MRVRSILVMGIGNPGRRDDGLGPACAERIESLRLPGVDCEASYQLRLEDARVCSVHDVVVFADAADRPGAPCSITPLEPSPRFTMSSHSLPPESLLAVCETVYGRSPQAFLLAIRGYRWEIGEGLSPGARKSLAAAVEALSGFIRNLPGRARGRKHPSLKKETPCRKKKSSS